MIAKQELQPACANQKGLFDSVVTVGTVRVRVAAGGHDPLHKRVEPARLLARHQYASPVDTVFEGDAVSNSDMCSGLHPKAYCRAIAVWKALAEGRDIQGVRTVTHPIEEHVVKTARHTSFYLACGATDATPIIFVHGWPELSISWRHQLPVLAGLGFRAIAPDMRGYGRSSVYDRHDAYCQEEIVADLIELVDHLGFEKAVWVGHDWGAPTVWSVAQQHPERCHGVAALCVPYIPGGFSPENIIQLANREVYPEAQFPAAQWDYMLFYRENFAAAVAGFEGNVRNTVKVLFRAGDPEGRGKPGLTGMVRAIGGWFGPGGSAPELPRDESVLTQEDENRYVSALQANGFFGPDSWYMNGPANEAYAARAKASLDMPVLFLHALYDGVCETVDSRLAELMRAACPNLTEAIVPSGHWMAQEKPDLVNAALAKWLAAQMPELWPS